jgi:hypothetical protein
MSIIVYNALYIIHYIRKFVKHYLFSQILPYLCMRYNSLNQYLVNYE